MDKENYDQAVADYEKVYKMEKTKGIAANFFFFLFCLYFC
jgi:hypothetical protein